MREAGIPLTFYGIRMDSGDLAYLSKEAKKCWMPRASPMR